MLPRLARFLVVCALCASTLALDAHRGRTESRNRPELFSSWSPPDSLPPEPEPVTPPTTEAPQPVEPPWPSDAWWDRLAICETGGDYTWHGPTYSSAYGVITAGVREFADSPESAQRILAGTADKAEQQRMAQRLFDRHGAFAWTCTHTIGRP